MAVGNGAERWSAKVDDLVRAYWTVQHNDDNRAHGSILVWAWWSLAMAFAARATAGRRELVLRVRQRPSRGREGRLDLDAWRQEPHDFAT